MCGRYSLGRTDRLDWAGLGVAPLPDLAPHWNIAPGADVLAIREGGAGRQAVTLRWGLIPSWAKDPAIGHRLANARAESADMRTAFRDAFRLRRCILPADGFYEWEGLKGQKRRQPWRVEARDGGILALGAIWESWRDPEGDPLETCTILTVPANETIEPIHDRMPVIVARGDIAAWLSPKRSVGDAKALCHPAPDDLLDCWRVSFAINTATNDDATVAARVQA